MKNIYALSLILTLITTSAFAKVVFITEKPDGDAGYGVVDGIKGSNDGSSVEISNQIKCSNEGYIRSLCGQGFYLIDRCPYDAKYYKSCCSDEYEFDYDDCIKKGGRPSTLPCGNKYRCD